MNDLHDRLDDYLGASPATTIDLDRIVNRGRRARRMRVAGVLGAAAAVCAVVAITAAMRPVALRPDPAASTPAPVVSSAAPLPTADRLLAAVREAVTEAAPEVGGLDTFQRQMRKCDVHPGRMVPYDEQTRAQACPRDMQYPEQYHWEGRLTRDGKTYRVAVSIGPVVYRAPSPPSIDDTDAQADVANGTAPRLGPNGESVQVFPDVLRVEKPDGTGIDIHCRADDPDAIPNNVGPFSVAELTAIGLNPALVL
ncbi:hypothetical protein [Catellatospora tritici]|uniref:hypothetical protein n=1 Tax=Catellatospora tritici TaxID=2851566 RepID=UPI001C2DF146|nr:hypothetical protein [Catellatospora tritici]MBV1849893.1 hypothetical protein [Catellatospora tritici]